MRPVASLPKNPREILGLDEQCSLEEVKLAYRAAMKLYHPDLYPGTDGTAAIALNRAYQELCEGRSGGSIFACINE